MDEVVSLQILDYVVIVLTLSVSLGIGVFFAVKDYKNVTRSEYLLGGRRMTMLPVALSIFATFTSGLSLMGLVTDIYINGFMASTINMGKVLGSFLKIYTVVPLLYPLRLTSVYEYHQLRFQSNALRIFVVIIGLIQIVCYMAMSLLSPALALQTGAKMPLWMSVGIVGTVGTVYTTIGGIKSVVWTDAFQTLVMLVGVLTIIIKGVNTVGGARAVWTISSNGGRTEFANFNPDPRVRDTWWGAIFGATVMWLTNICSQSSVQRISAMKSIKDVKTAFLTTVVMYLILWGLLLGMGWVMYAYFVHFRCDPLKAGLITKADQLPPYFVMHALTDLPGMGGIYFAMIFSGALSTLSSGINALAAITVEDLLKKPLKNRNESTITLITKVLVFLYGVLAIGLAYGAYFIQGPIVQISIGSAGAWGGPIVGIFLLGALVPWGNKYGAFGGGIIALCINMWIVLGNLLYGRKMQVLFPPPNDMCLKNDSRNYLRKDNNTSIIFYKNVTLFLNVTTQVMTSDSLLRKSDPSGYGFFLYDISYKWFGLVGTLISLGFGAVISYCFRHRCPIATENKLLFNFVQQICLSRRPGQSPENHEADGTTKLMQYKTEGEESMLSNTDSCVMIFCDKMKGTNSPLNV